MSLEQIWAGWRAHYVATVANAPSPGAEGDGTSCVFCRLLASDEPAAQRHVLFESASSAALLNAYPYASGHLLVMPRRHVGTLGELSGLEASELWSAVRDAVAALEAAYHPDGCNIGANIGRAAGAGIPDHLHIHVVPRWSGDTNFMTTVAGVRVMPEALADSWGKLHAAWPR